MNIELYRQWTIKDASGKVIKRTRKRLSDSYVIAFIDILFAQCRGLAVDIDIQDTANATRALSNNASNFLLAAGVDVSIYGLVVGTGTNAVALTNYALQTFIAHGTSAGQLQYGAVTVNVPTTVGSTRKFTVTRTFTNGSGGTVTVNETGIYCRGESWNFCIARDLEDPGQAIADAATGTLTYTISTTV